MRTSDLGGYDLVLAPLDSSSVLVVTTERRFTLRWGVLRDTSWTSEPEPLNRANADYGDFVSMIRQSGGRLRIAWAGFDGVLRSRVYQQGVWVEPESIRVALPDTIQHLFYQAELSREESDHPALAWYGYKIQDDVAYYIWVACPSDSGFGVGEKLAGSWQGINPTCLVDENGDVWVAWWRTFDGMYWTHSYCAATPSEPSIGEEHGRPLLRWPLSESAPGTWWAVLRSTVGAPPEPVARVRAGAGLAMGWADSTAPTGATLRYAIRRECREVRYRVTSAEAEWRSRGSSIELALRSRNPAASAVRFELSGAAAGTYEVTLYDVFGRRIAHRRETATGSGIDQFELLLANAVHPGLYLLRVRGADGRVSRAAKVVVVRKQPSGGEFGGDRHHLAARAHPQAER